MWSEKKLEILLRRGASGTYGKSELGKTIDVTPEIGQNASRWQN